MRLGRGYALTIGVVESALVRGLGAGWGLRWGALARVWWGLRVDIGGPSGAACAQLHGVEWWHKGGKKGHTGRKRKPLKGLHTHILQPL